MSDDLPIRFTSPDEIRARPAWKDGIDHRAHRIAKFVGDYDFSKADEWACGLKDCRTKHQRGIVIATIDGIETHVGHICGKERFGFDWDQHSAQYDRAAADRDRRERLSFLLTQRDALLPRAEKVLSEISAATADIKRILDSIDREPRLAAALATAVRRGGAIQEEQVVDAGTAQALNLSESQRRQFVTIARLDGAVAIARPPLSNQLPSAQYLSVLRGRILPGLRGLSADQLNGLNERQRKECAKDMEQIIDDLNRAEMLLAEMRRFLAPDNLRQLAQLRISNPSDRARRILRSFEA